MVALPRDVQLWPYRRIPYEFEHGYPLENDVRAAMTIWEEASGVVFVVRQREENYLIIRKPTSGRSMSAVGMRKGPQAVYINAGFLALHELGHALGLIHEQCRTDREQHIEVQWENIEYDHANHNFEIEVDSVNMTPYDRASVMHYPAPATGWQGYPHDQETWTMRWKTNRYQNLGPDTWTNLSALDREGIRAAYSKVTVAMGNERATGKWNNPYAVQFPVFIASKQFFYMHNLDNYSWYIQELLPEGKMGSTTHSGKWNNPYAVQFPFFIAGKQFIYMHNLDNYSWYIQELLPEGKMGSTTHSGKWNNPYAVQFPFTIGGRQFFYGQNQQTRYWFIQELLPGGKMGNETDSGRWNNPYAVQFPFTIGGKQFFYGQDLSTNYWFIQELLPGGKMGNETDNGRWNNPYAIQFPFTIGGKQFFYGQNQQKRYWFIQELLPGGKMGNELQGGFWQQSYAIQFPFTINKRQYIYGQDTKGDYSWFIQSLT